MNCEQVKALLSPYLDNQLAPAEYEVVSSHLCSCSLCRSILSDYRHFDALISQLPMIEPSPSLRISLSLSLYGHS